MNARTLRELYPSNMHRIRVHKLAVHIDAQPDIDWQNEWHGDVLHAPSHCTETQPCGRPAGLAGHALAMFATPGTLQKLARRMSGLGAPNATQEDVDCFNGLCRDEARQHLWLDATLGEQLFNPPDGWRPMPRDAMAVLDYLLVTGTVDWPAVKVDVAALLREASQCMVGVTTLADALGELRAHAAQSGHKYGVENLLRHHKRMAAEMAALIDALQAAKVPVA